MFERERALAGHHGGIREHVPVVPDVVGEKSFRRVGLLAIALVRCDRFQVADDRVVPPPDTNVDVGRHVNVVAEAGLQIAQPIRRGHGALGMRRRLERVDGEVIRERMIGIELQHRVERREYFVGARLRLALGRPLVPRMRVHHRLREQHAGVRLARKTFPRLAHRVRIRTIERAAVGGLRVRVAFRECGDERAFERGGTGDVLLREREFRPRLRRRGRRHHREVDVRAVGERDAPMGHRTVRIKPRRLLERTDRRTVVEAEIEIQSLIEILLRVGRGRRDLARVRAEAVEERRSRGHRCAA